MKKDTLTLCLLILTVVVMVLDYGYLYYSTSSHIDYAYYRGIWSGCVIAEQNNPNVEKVCLDAVKYAKNNNWASWDALKGYK